MSDTCPTCGKSDNNPVIEASGWSVCNNAFHTRQTDSPSGTAIKRSEPGSSQIANSYPAPILATAREDQPRPSCSNCGQDMILVYQCIVCGKTTGLTNIVNISSDIQDKAKKWVEALTGAAIGASYDIRDNPERVEAFKGCALKALLDMVPNKDLEADDRDFNMIADELGVPRTREDILKGIRALKGKL